MMGVLLGSCGGRELHESEQCLVERYSPSFQQCAAWARESLGDDATAPEHMELTNSCLQMQREIEADSVA